jgi:hypothetical protein
MAGRAIKREGAPEVRGIHPQHGDRLEVVITLTDPPPKEWIRHLVGSFKDNPLYKVAPFPLPEVSGNRILISPKDEEFEGFVKSIDERIEKANEFYESRVLPGVQAEREQADRTKQAAEQRVKEARRKAREL